MYETSKTYRYLRLKAFDGFYPLVSSPEKKPHIFMKKKKKNFLHSSDEIEIS